MVRQIWRNKQAMLGLLMIMIVAGIAVLAPFLAPHDPQAVDPALKFLEPSREYLLGTDQLGRCLFSRLVYGARYSLGISVPILLVLVLISVPLGTISAYAGGLTDRIFTVICDIFIAFPPLLVALSLVGALGQGLTNIVGALVFSMWVWFAKIVRSYALLEKKKDYITAARIAGCSEGQIITRHLIPNILPALLVYFSTGLAGIVLVISGFAFLGMGIEAGVPEWGAMLSGGKNYLYSHPSLLIYPGMCILFTATGFNLLGEALRDISSPGEV